MLYPAIFVVYSTIYNETEDVSMIPWEQAIRHEQLPTDEFPGMVEAHRKVVHTLSYLRADPQSQTPGANRIFRDGRDELIHYFCFARPKLNAVLIWASGAAY
jgi:hypothetical protein